MRRMTILRQCFISGVRYAKGDVAAFPESVVEKIIARGLAVPEVSQPLREIATAGPEETAAEAKPRRRGRPRKA